MGPEVVTWYLLGIQGNDEAEVLGDAVQDEPAGPQLVAHRDSFARSDLKNN